MSVASAGASHVWAVGIVGSPNSSIWETLIEEWSGTQWTADRSPNPAPYNQLWGVAAVSSTEAWAVGEFCTHPTTSKGVETLVEQGT